MSRRQPDGRLLREPNKIPQGRKQSTPPPLATSPRDRVPSPRGFIGSRPRVSSGVRKGILARQKKWITPSEDPSAAVQASKKRRFPIYQAATPSRKSPRRWRSGNITTALYKASSFETWHHSELRFTSRRRTATDATSDPSRFQRRERVPRDSASRASTPEKLRDVYLHGVGWLRRLVGELCVFLRDVKRSARVLDHGRTLSEQSQQPVRRRKQLPRDRAIGCCD